MTNTKTKDATTQLIKVEKDNKNSRQFFHARFNAIFENEQILLNNLHALNNKMQKYSAKKAVALTTVAPTTVAPTTEAEAKEADKEEEDAQTKKAEAKKAKCDSIKWETPDGKTQDKNKNKIREFDIEGMIKRMNALPSTKSKNLNYTVAKIKDKEHIRCAPKKSSDQEKITNTRS